MDNDDVVSTLNDLIETSNDGQHGFRSCADHAESPELKKPFNNRAEDYRQAVGELQEQILKFGGEPETSGSAPGALHRGWVAIRRKRKPARSRHGFSLNHRHWSSPMYLCLN